MQLSMKGSLVDSNGLRAVIKLHDSVVGNKWPGTEAELLRIKMNIFA